MYTCETCGFVFYRVSNVTQCPLCEQSHIRPATEQEEQQLKKKLKEIEAPGVSEYENHEG